MAATNAEITTKYQKKKEKEHILDNPDTYTGSMDVVDTTAYVFDDSSNSIKLTELTDVIMGLYKLFDEAVVNCRDQHVRLANAMKICKPNTMPLTYIDISISDDGTLTFTNDGNGIDIVEHPELPFFPWLQCG